MPTTQSLAVRLGWLAQRSCSVTLVGEGNSNCGFLDISGGAVGAAWAWGLQHAQSVAETCCEALWSYVCL